ncbi:MAG: hypothetical protein AAF699_21050 [Pseudomonadota bacterium]
MINWDAIGAGAELIAAVAVIATLVYLAVQIRQNTQSNQNTAIQTISGHKSEWLSLITQDSEVAALAVKGNADYEALTVEEMLRFTTLFMHFYRLYETQYHLYLNSAVPNDLWLGSSQTLQFGLQGPGARLVWDQNRERFSPSFQTLVDELLADT